MAETMTPAKVTAAKADAAAEAKAAATKLDEAPPVADPVHSMLGSMLSTMEAIAALVPGAHNIRTQCIQPMKAALAAMTAPPK
jgi:hypothetical protein